MVQTLKFSLLNWSSKVGISPIKEFILLFFKSWLKLIIKEYFLYFLSLFTTFMIKWIILITVIVVIAIYTVYIVNSNKVDKERTIMYKGEE